jgi:hypothetical protein
MFRAVAVAPLTVSVAFQVWLMVWPGASVQVAVQPLIAERPAVMVTSPWNPPELELTVRYRAVHAPPGGRLDGGGLETGGLDGGRLDGGRLDPDGAPPETMYIAAACDPTAALGP